MFRCDLVDPQLRQKRREPGNATPRPECRALVVQHHLRPTVSRHRLLERFADHRCPLRVVDTVADDESAVVVDQDQREGRGPIDVLVHEIQMPQVIRPYRLEPLVMGLPFDLWRPIPCVLHHAPRGVHRDPHPLATQLVADLARSEPRVPLPLL